jgi:1-acyl-sn-glycerol-3-phosphate acyltransferase
MAPISGRADGGAERLLAILRDFARDSHLPVSSGDLGLDAGLETDLGLDSLARSELIGRIERGLGATLPPEALLAATPRDLLVMLGDAAGATPEVSRQALKAPLGQRVTGSPESADTLLDALRWHLERHPDRTHILLEDDDGAACPITYGDLAAGAGRVAGLLHREGLKAGETVALMLPTGREYFFSFMGALVAGGVPVPIYPPARPEQLEDHLRRHARILDNARCVILITMARARLVARLLRAQVSSLRGILTLEALDGQAAVAPIAAPAASDMAFLQYTSGSTGDPKGVILSHADLLANIRAMGRAAEVRSDDIFVSWLPLYHDMGLIGAWLGSLYYGLTLVSMSPLAFLARPRRWLQAIDRHRGTMSAAPNFAYELCLKRLTDADLEGLDLSSWRWAFNGAEPVSPDTLRRFAQRFGQCGLRPEALAPVYGLAEAAVGLAFPPPNRGPRIDCIDRTRFARQGYALPLPCEEPGVMEVVACGRPLPGYRVRVVDDEGIELAERHEGLLEFQGPSATRGYFRRPEATAAMIRDGWHDTGDRAYLAGGEIYLTGRVKDLIIRGGRNIYPYELEEAIGDVEGIRKGCVAVFAAADPSSGTERLIVVAETRERDPQRRRILERKVRERTGDVVGIPPDEVVLTPPRAIPKTSSGKLRRGSARDLYLGGRLRAGPRSPLRQLLRVGAAGLRMSASRLVTALPGYLYAGYAWALLLLIAPWVWLGVVTLPRPGWRWRLVRAGTRLLRRLAGVRLSVEGRERLPEAGRCFVLAANHQSYLDSLAIIEAIPRPLAFIAKRELAGRTWIRLFLERLGTLFVERFDPHGGTADAERFSVALRRGDVLAFFPEGTFREAPGLLPFRMGAFVAAAQHDLPILPVAVTGTRQVMTGDRFVPRPGRCRVQIAIPLAPAGRDWEHAVALRDATRKALLGATGEPDLERHVPIESPEGPETRG